MGKRIVLLDPAILRTLVEEGMTWHLHIKTGLPDDATFCHAWMEGGPGDTSTLALVFTSATWSETPEGEAYPTVPVEIASLGWHETEAEFLADQHPAHPIGRVYSRVK